MAAKQTEEEPHKVFTNDPLYFKGFVDSVVNVETVHGRIHNGILYTVDPVSETVILLIQMGESLKVEMIMGYNVKNIQHVEPSNTLKIPENLFKENWTKYISEEELEKKKTKLKEWLLKNSIPITEREKLLMLNDVLTIEPPYGPDQCVSNNEMVLDKIQSLVKSLPV